MSRARDVSKTVLSIGFAVASVVIVGLGVRYDWKKAEDFTQGNRRLRWVVEARRALPKNAEISEHDIAGRARWLHHDPSAPHRLPQSSQAVGLFAARRIDPDEVLTADDLVSAPLLAADHGEAIVPVAVSALHAGALNPGSRLIFVNEDGMVLPASAIEEPGGDASAFELVAIVGREDGDESSVSLLVRVSDSQRPCITALASKIWRPVAVGPIGAELE